MEKYVCPHCGSEKTTISKSVWNTKDIIIAVVLFLMFFPAGIVYVIVKQNSNKQQVCPDCKKPYLDTQGTSNPVDISKIKTTVRNIATDPNVRQSVRDLKKSAKEFQDSLDV